MLRVERLSGKLVKLTKTTLGDAGIEERSGLQELILKNVNEFFREECREILFVVKEEVEPSNQVGDRIDLLAIDTKGKAVVVELKRGSHKLQLLQALTYAAMIAAWSKEDIDQAVPLSKRDGYKEFLDEYQIVEINEFQRIILIAESFDFEVLNTAEWLTNSYGINITCFQISLAKDELHGHEYLSALRLTPPPKLAAQARRRGALKSEEGTKFKEIEELLRVCNNEEVKSYFHQGLSRSIRRNKRRDSLVYPELGKMRFRVRPKGDYARVSQLGRFEGDEAYWTTHLSTPTMRLHLADMRFRLHTRSDIEAFERFTREQMSSANWTKASVSDEEDAVEDE